MKYKSYKSECIIPSDMTQHPMHVKQLLNFIFKNTRVSLNWENNIKMDLRETEWGGIYWTHLAQLGTNGEHSNERVKFHKMLGISRVAAQLAAS